MSRTIFLMQNILNDFVIKVFLRVYAHNEIDNHTEM
jgi:hypothetical protein